MSDTPPLPTPRLPSGGGSHRRQADRNGATFVALFGMLLMGAAFIGMTALILPQIRGLILVFGGAIGFFVLHYILWGWWLPKYIHDSQEADS